VAGIVPAIAYYLPDAKIVPLALRGDLDIGQVRALARTLAPLLDDGTVIVASVDFSHYLSAMEARARDAETLAAMQAMDSRALLSFGDEHLDSPPTIALLSEMMRLLNRGEFTLRGNTNSGELSGLVRPPVTSYVSGYYR
jgi:AmmeMemoRadiSam system protein B